MAHHELHEMLRSNVRVNRRGFLKASGFAGSAAFLAACSTGTTSSAPSADPGASVDPGSSAGPGASYATEGALFMYNWADYVDPDNMAEFQARYAIEEFTYDIYPSNEELLTRLQGGATGLFDIACPTCEFVPQMADEGFIVELDFARLPNAAFINPTFQNFFDPAGPQGKYNSYQIPKDWGTTGISVRTKVVTEEVKTWKQFFEVAPNYSGRIVVVESAGDVLTAPLKALGYSLNSVDPTELGEARELLRGLAPHVLVLDSDTYDAKLANEEAVLGLTWTGGIDELKAEPETADTVYNVPEDGTLYWMDSWVLLEGAPHPEAAYAWLNFIHEPAIQAKETETNYYATPNDEAKKLVDPELLANPTVFVPDEAFANLEGANNVSTDPLRVEIWEEFVSRIGGYAGGFTFENYFTVFASPEPFVTSLTLAIFGTVLCLLVGLPLAYFIATRAGSRKSLFIVLLVIPFWTSFLIRTYAWLLIIGPEGIAGWVGDLIGNSGFRILGTEYGVLIGMVYGYLPLMVFPLYVTLERMDRTLVEASKDLGAGRWATFRQVTLPIAMPGLITGSILVFIPMMGEYVVPRLLGYGQVFTIGNALVLRFLEARNWPAGSAYAAVLILIMMVTITVYVWLTNRGRRTRDVSVL